MSSTQIDLAGLKKFIFTFGSGQKYEGRCQPIYAKDDRVAREKMFEVHGEAWGFMYTGAQWEKFRVDPNRLWEMETELQPIIVLVEDCGLCGDTTPDVEFRDDADLFLCESCYDDFLEVIEYEEDDYEL